jgi:hypothetical protein
LAEDAASWVIDHFGGRCLEAQYLGPVINHRVPLGTLR